MNHGYDDDDEYDYGTQAPMAPTGPSLLSQLLGGHMGMGTFSRSAPPHAYDEYLKAYSVAVMGGNERPELLYGGKIVMPPSHLAKLTNLDIESPWTFQLRNPRNPAVNQTHAGVLEFIAEEGIVHLPAWMMKALDLNEGDPVRLTGARLKKGKMVKIQAQSTDFLQVSDAKAVLESALRFYSCLTKGDIIEITYNSLTFEFLIMETTPEGNGISILDTDLEVDFAAPKGYVEPARPAPAPIPTMADKLKIDLGGTTPASAGTIRPGSAASLSRSGGAGGSGDATPKESFTGVGQSLSGRRVKGKGLAKPIEEVDPSSKINRNDGPRIITPETLNDKDRKVPAALVLPAGKFFFGYTYVPFDPAKAPKKVDIDAAAAAGPSTFAGSGNTLGNRRSAPQSVAPQDPGPSTSSSTQAAEEKPDPWAGLGGGNTLSGRPVKREAPASRSPPPERSAARSAPDQRAAPPSDPPSPPPDRNVIDATMLDEDDFFQDAYDDEDEDEDDNDIIEIDSD